MFTDFLYVPVNESDMDYDSVSDSVKSDSDSVRYEDIYSDSYTDTFSVRDYSHSLDFGWR